MGKKKRKKEAKLRGSTPVFTRVNDEWVQLPLEPPLVASDDGMTPVHIVGNGGRLGAPFVASETSYEAAQKIEPSTAILRERVYNHIQVYGPVTDERISEWTGINPSTVRPRRVELLRAGRIVQAGYGVTAAGRKAQLWAVA